jgi:hypothetical protein
MTSKNAYHRHKKRDDRDSRLQKIPKDTYIDPKNGVGFLQPEQNRTQDRPKCGHNSNRDSSSNDKFRDGWQRPTWNSILIYLLKLWDDEEQKEDVRRAKNKEDNQTDSDPKSFLLRRARPLPMLLLGIAHDGSVTRRRPTDKMLFYRPLPSFPNSIWERNCPRNSIALRA